MVGDGYDTKEMNFAVQVSKVVDCDFELYRVNRNFSGETPTN